MKLVGDLGLSTVVDDHPRFWCEFVLWTLCANDHLEVPKRVYFVGCRPKSLISFATKNGVEVKFSETLIPRAPHCNKLIPFLDPDGFENQIVSDSDLFFAGDVAEFFLPEIVRLPPNNHAYPSLKIFEKVFESACVRWSPEPGTALFEGSQGRETYSGNVSAGLIFIPSSQRSVARHWLECARWLSRNSSLLGAAAVHIDQVSFALAVAKFSVPFRHLPAQASAVLELLPQISTVYGFHLTSGHIPHFPDWFEADKTLKWEKINPNLEEPARRLNGEIRRAVGILDGMPETSDFLGKFLNPAYRR